MSREIKRSPENTEFHNQISDLTTRSMNLMLELCEIPSPTGYTAKAEKFVLDYLEKLGFKPWQSVKGGVWCCLDPKHDATTAEADDAALLLAAHIDTLGLMVRHIKADGRLRLTTLGSFPYNYVEQENVLVFTREGTSYEGSVHLINPAVHASREVNDKKRDDASVELVLDEQVFSREDVAALGISAGDFVALEARARLAGDGYLKSRHLDDKASAAMLLVLAEEIAAGRLQPSRKVYLYFSNYEEVGHGAASGHPLGIKDMLAVDMGVVGTDLDTDEHVLSICAKDSSGPYNFEFTTELVNIAKAKELEHCVDIYPFYGSDASCAMAAGYDYRFALVGTGVANSHGYERIHRRGVTATIALLHCLIAEAK
ncbi:MAG: M42 family metallopeptidase [Eubacteriales bacterium]|nr:M42 family metallopeptidase [Eubacteriales bacterium]